MSATVAGASETYAYDGDGVRVSRTVGANPVIRYVSDPAAGLPLTLDDGTRKYVWGQGLAYAVSGTTLEVFHTDRLGSVRALTDATGVVTATYRTDEFGVPTATTGTSSQPFGFTGEPRDATGLTYLRARYYDPALGRFMSRDTWAGRLGNVATLNRYSYAFANPLRFTDRSGLSPSLVTDAPGGIQLPPWGGTKATDVRVPSDVPLIGGCKAGQLGIGVAQVFVGTVLEVVSGLGDILTLGTATPVAIVVVAVGAGSYNQKLWMSIPDTEAAYPPE